MQQRKQTEKGWWKKLTGESNFFLRNGLPIVGEDAFKRLRKWEAEAKGLWRDIWESFYNTWVLRPYLAGEDVFPSRLMTNGIWVLEVLLRAILIQLLILQMKRVKPVKLLGSALSTVPPTLIVIRIIFARQGGEMNNKPDI